MGEALLLREVGEALLLREVAGRGEKGGVGLPGRICSGGSEVRAQPGGASEKEDDGQRASLGGKENAGGEGGGRPSEDGKTPVEEKTGGEGLSLSDEADGGVDEKAGGKRSIPQGIVGGTGVKGGWLAKLKRIVDKAGAGGDGGGCLNVPMTEAKRPRVGEGGERS